MNCLSCEDPTLVFVFGSNEAGRHGMGAALHALRHHGAIYGQGAGNFWHKDGGSYAIPTKDASLRSLHLEDIQQYVYQFLDFARRDNEVKYNLTRIGCGLAGYTDADIAPMFADAPINVIKPKGW